MKQKIGRKLLSFLLTLAMVIGLVPGMSLTAYAATDTYTALKNNATVVQFNGYNWYIIEDNSTSATEGTVTLLAADNGFGLSKFSDSNSNAYSSSKIKVALDLMTAEGGAFAGVADAIADTDLTDVSVTGAKLYLLSTSEAGNLNQTILEYNYPGADRGKYWLRSPGNDDSSAAFVRGQLGHVVEIGDPVERVAGVRPALKLNLSKVTFDSTSKTFSLKPSHTHSFTYAASGATITATCGAAGCDLPESKATLTIAAPTLTTYGQTGEGISADATITDANGIQGEAKIQYQKKTGDATYDTATETAPTDAGTYKASITLGEGTGAATASVEYTIAQATTTITENPTPGAITYGQKLANSTLTGGTASVAGSFAWKDSTVAPAVSDSQKTEYDVVFTPTDANYATATCKVKLTVNKAEVTAPTIASKSYTGQKQTADVASSTRYSVTTNNGGTNVGSYNVVLTLTDSANYKWSDSAEAAKTLKFNITKATANTVTVNIEGWTYGEAAKAPTSTATFGTAAYTYAIKGSTQFAAEVPTNAGEYTVKAAVAGTTNYPAGEATADFTIAKKIPAAGVDFTVEPLQLTYTGVRKELVRQTILTDGLEIEYSFDGASVETGLPMKKASGEYQIYYRVKGNDNYENLDWSDPMLATIRMYATFSNPDFVLPPFLTEIGEEAFAEDTSLTTMDADNCAFIDAYAFRDCTNLKRICLPLDCEIDDTAFDGCVALRAIFAPSGGTTAAWCASHDVNFVPISQN